MNWVIWKHKEEQLCKDDDDDDDDGTYRIIKIMKTYRITKLTEGIKERWGRKMEEKKE